MRMSARNDGARPLWLNRFDFARVGSAALRGGTRRGSRAVISPGALERTRPRLRSPAMSTAGRAGVSPVRSASTIACPLRVWDPWPRPCTTMAGSPGLVGAAILFPRCLRFSRISEHEAALVAGFLSQREQFGSVEIWLDRLAPSLRMWANLDGIRLGAGKETVSDWAAIVPGMGGKELWRSIWRQPGGRTERASASLPRSAGAPGTATSTRSASRICAPVFRQRRHCTMRFRCP